MAKTAEDILRKNGVNAFPNCAIGAMQEFAAQEVEAYRERLRTALFKRISETGGMEHFSKSDIHEIIDTVK